MQTVSHSLGRVPAVLYIPLPHELVEECSGGGPHESMGMVPLIYQIALDALEPDLSSDGVRKSTNGRVSRQVSTPGPAERSACAAPLRT